MTVVERPRSCRCGARYCSATFAKLESVRQLAAEEIAVLVVAWPSDVVVDVRTCASCAAPIAKLVTRT